MLLPFRAIERSLYVFGAGTVTTPPPCFAHASIAF